MAFFLYTAGLALLLALVCPLAAAHARTPDLRSLKTADERIIYKTVDGDELYLYAFYPEDLKPGDRRPAIVMFHGGGWRQGSPASMAPFARYFAERGLVCFSASYRLISKDNGLDVRDCVTDAKSALRWVRRHADRYGIDPDRIIASGGSAGGHLAAAVAIVPGFDDEGDDLTVSPSADALVLFNPALVLTPLDGLPESFNREQAGDERVKRYGDPAAVSPYEHIAAGQPPMLLLYGTEDWWCDSARRFKTAYIAAGNGCTLETWEGAKHGFYHYRRNNPRYFIATCDAAHRFLATLGYLDGEPDTRGFLEAHLGPGFDRSRRTPSVEAR